MLRVYVDCTTPPVWSVDYGDISTEKHFDEVFVNCPGVTNHDTTADNVNNPKIWLEFYDAVLEEEDGIAYILKES